MAMVTTSATTLSKESITSQSFGGNYIFNRGTMGGNIGETGAFDEFAQKMGVYHLRYPGGSVAEQLLDLSGPKIYDENDPNSAVGFLKQASAINAKVTIVLPSAKYIQAILGGDAHARSFAETEIKAFVQNILKSGYGSIVEGFELGNEFYGTSEYLTYAATSAQNVGKVYGLVASQMAIWVEEAISSAKTGNDPAIIVQAGQTSGQNADVIGAFSASGLEAIDGVTVHNYRWNAWTEQGTTTNKFAFMNAWQSKVGERDLIRVVSEWNIGSPNGVTGLPAAAGLLDMFNLQERLGVDLAHVWPLLQNNNNTLGASPSKAQPNLAPNVTIEGEVFRQMSRALVGLSPYDLDSRLDIDADGKADALLHAYGNGTDKLVVYFSSVNGVANDFILDLNSLGGIVKHYTHLWAQVTGVVQGSNPLIATSAPVVKTLVAGAIEGTGSNDGILSFSLQPYEIIALEFTTGRGVTLHGHDQTVQNDELIGTNFNDDLYGYLGNDSLYGGIGDDTLDGGVGTDVMSGGKGNDVYFVDRTDDTVVESANEGIDAVYSSVSYTLSHNLENLTLTGTGRIHGTGNAASNQINGNAGNNNLIGLDGDDTIFGGDGNDVLDGGAGSDYLVGGTGNDTYYLDSASDFILEHAGAGVDTVFFGAKIALLPSNVENLTLTKAAGSGRGTGNELSNVIHGNVYSNELYGLAGDDLIYGGNGKDRLFGGDGNDTLNGGVNADYMEGGQGDDVYIVDSPADIVRELMDCGTDLVKSSVSWILAPEFENLTLTGVSAVSGTGNQASNTIEGNGAANTLSGGGGNDTLIGGGGSDTLIGGAGADHFIFDRLGDVASTVMDFNGLDGGLYEGDVLLFKGLLHGSFDFLGTSAFTAGGESEARVAGGQVLVDVDGNGTTDLTVIMAGLTRADQLSFNDFVWT